MVSSHVVMLLPVGSGIVAGAAGPPPVGGVVLAGRAVDGRVVGAGAGGVVMAGAGVDGVTGGVVAGIGILVPLIVTVDVPLVVGVGTGDAAAIVPPAVLRAAAAKTAVMANPPFAADRRVFLRISYSHP